MRVITVLAVLILTTPFAGRTLGVGPTATEMQQQNQWVKKHLLEVHIEPAPATASGRGDLPFTFVLGGQASDSLLANWPRKTDSRQLPQDRTQHTFTWSDAKTGLEVRCVAVQYADFPVVEWTVYLRNTGSENTPLLEHIQALDTRLERAAEGEFLLRHHKGDTCAPDLYQPLETVLAPQASHRFVPGGGRPTNGVFPYYNLVLPGGGLTLVVGWPGQWAATFARDAERGLRITAGQELTHLVLQPGEEIRTPLIALMFWEGTDPQRTQNLWRRWMIAHNLPRTKAGKLPPPIMPGNTSLEFNEMCDASEENQKYFIDRYVEERVKIDHWWMDAGWYPCNGWPQTGTWEPDLKRFPQGLRAISDHARPQGIKTLVWFEPERVAGGTWLALNHPEWLLGGTLLNLGNPVARQWLTDHVDRVLREQGIDLYRQDFNMDPLDFWRRNDAPDRQGLTENLHVQGYLAYWDALRQRHPNLIIDSCASGGRRNDLETLRRAVPLHPTDYNYSHLAAKQAFHHSLFQWIPYFGSNTVPVDNVDAYGFRSGHALGVVLGYDLRRKDLDYDLLRKLTDEVRLATRYYYADYYPLTPYSLSEDAWLAWQFHQPETGEGVVEVFRRPRSAEASLALKLRGLDAAAVYEMQNTDLEGSTRATGRELLERGLQVRLPRRPQAALITYRRIQALAAVSSASLDKCEVLQQIAFSGQETYSPQGEIASYGWDFGDGATASGPVAEHAYQTPGTYAAKLTVKDPQGRTDTAGVTVTVIPVDTTVPELVAVAAGEPEQVAVVFSKPIARSTAETISNYALDRDAQVHSAVLGPDLATVTLKTSVLAEGVTYGLTVNNIQDRARTPHTLARNSRQAFQYSGLVAWWRLDEGQGDAAADSSGNGQHGTLTGAQSGPTWTKSDRGLALSFDGVDDCVDTGTCLPNLALPLSITVWVNPAATQVAHADILGNHGEPYVGINLQQDGTKTNAFGFGYGDGQRWQGTGSAQLQADQWQHVAVVCDGQQAVLYVNGVEQSRGPAQGPLAPNPTQNFKLGQGYHSSRYFHGLLSDVRIYRKALSAADLVEAAKGQVSPGK
ncbi:MAG: alpha-galactosidase [Planctomycetota bacterium]|nr:alpha-galactosidase [Planctomycetota bacterium]